MRTATTLAVIALMFLAASAATAAAPATQPARASIPITVDRRVELICIIFRLAGAEEYARGRIASYNKDVDAHFASMKDHPAVKMVGQLRRTRGVGYDAPMSLVAHINNPPDMTEIVPLDPIPSDLDSRWRTDEVRDFLKQARDFARQSRFEEFFVAHEPLYRESVARMSATMARKAHLEWFDKFFGKRTDVDFHLVLGMLNGGNCYGSRCAKNGRVDMYCVLGVWDSDSKGMPVFADSVVPTVIHEFTHSYVNPLVDKYETRLEPAGKKLFASAEDVMRKQAYGHWKTTVIESLVRACVIRYRYANDGMVAGWSEVAEQRSRGFAWVRGLSDMLAEYEKTRDKYPTLDAYMPVIIGYLNRYTSVE